MKNPDLTIKRIINNKEYEIYIFYIKSARAIYFEFESGHLIFRLNSKHLNTSRFENFLVKSITKAIKNPRFINEKKLKINTKNQSFYYFGELISYDITSNFIIFKVNNSFVYLKLPKDYSIKTIEEKIKNFLKEKLLIKFKFFAEEAVKVILQKTIDLTYKILKKKTSWASINIRTKTLNICADLMYFSDEMIKYVAYHEICHLVHANHSKEFWNLLSKYLDNWKDIRKKLNSYILK